MLVWQSELERIFSSPLPVPDPFRPVSPDGIVLYGAGAMGKMALALFKEKSIIPKYIIDKQVKAEIGEVKVILPENISSEDFKRYTFIVCVATIPVSPIFDYLKSLGCVDVRHFYDYSEIALKELMPNGWAVFCPTAEQKKEINLVCSMLAHDELSIAHYLQFLWWRLRRKEVLYLEWPVLSNKKFFDTNSFPVLSDNEVFVDVGAHFGQTILSFLKKVNGKFRRILAFEPDLRNQAVLRQNLSNIKLEIFDEALGDSVKIVKFHDGLGYASRVNDLGNKSIRVTSIDAIAEIKPTIIKLHIEGAELSALNGAEKTIQKYRPILMVLADHSPDGLYKIARFLYKQKHYKLFFNLHDYCGNSAVFYAYPQKY